MIARFVTTKPHLQARLMVIPYSFTIRTNHSPSTTLHVCTGQTLAVWQLLPVSQRVYMKFDEFPVVTVLEPRQNRFRRSVIKYLHATPHSWVTNVADTMLYKQIKVECQNIGIVSEYLIQSHSHCLSHRLPPEKQHLGLRPKGHRYALSICLNNLCERCFISRCLCYLIILHMFSTTVSAIVLHLTFAFVICLF